MKSSRVLRRRLRGAQKYDEQWQHRHCILLYDLNCFIERPNSPTGILGWPVLLVRARVYAANKTYSDCRARVFGSHVAIRKQACKEFMTFPRSWFTSWASSSDLPSPDICPIPEPPTSTISTLYLLNIAFFFLVLCAAALGSFFETFSETNMDGDRIEGLASLAGAWSVQTLVNRRVIRFASSYAPGRLLPAYL